MTGCLFINEADIVCGNPTMLPLRDDNWVRQFESVFTGIHLSKIDHETDSLIDNILFYIKYKLLSFRTLVQNDKIECFLNVKTLDVAEDTAFAKQLRELNPYGIEWSNLPDFINRLHFLEFAKRCSSPDTIHFFHSLNWTDHVFGARYTPIVIENSSIKHFNFQFLLEIALSDLWTSVGTPRDTKTKLPWETC